MSSNSNFEYDFAISFAGEQREIAEKIVKFLEKEKARVFYDRNFESKMLGKKLTTYFQETFGDKARYVIIIISKEYPNKDWTNLELSIARDEAKKRSEEFILPLRLDDTHIIGIHDDVCFLNLREKTIEEAVEILIKKLTMEDLEKSPNKHIGIEKSGKKIRPTEENKFQQLYNLFKAENDKELSIDLLNLLKRMNIQGMAEVLGMKYQLDGRGFIYMHNSKYVVIFYNYSDIEKDISKSEKISHKITRFQVRNRGFLVRRKRSLKFYYPNRPNKNHDVLEDFLEYYCKRCKDHNIRIYP